MFSYRSVCVCVRLCVCKISQQVTDGIWLNFWRGGSWRVQGTISLILVAIRIPFPYLPQIFIPVMHFQWNVNSLNYYSLGGTTSVGGGIRSTECSSSEMPRSVARFLCNSSVSCVHFSTVLPVSCGTIVWRLLRLKTRYDLLYEADVCWTSSVCRWWLKPRSCARFIFDGLLLFGGGFICQDIGPNNSGPCRLCTGLLATTIFP